MASCSKKFSENVQKREFNFLIYQSVWDQSSLYICEQLQSYIDNSTEEVD